MAMSSRRFTVCLELAVAIALVAAPGSEGTGVALAAQPAAWTGWARCDVIVRGSGYTDQQTHTWTLAGGAPAIQGAFRIYPGTWSVAGGGSLTRTQGAQTLQAEWATNVPPMDAPLAVFVRASDGRTFIQARHAQMRAPGAVQGYQQQTIDGVSQQPASLALEAFEWTFPMVEVSPLRPTASGSFVRMKMPPWLTSTAYRSMNCSRVSLLNLILSVTGVRFPCRVFGSTKANLRIDHLCACARKASIWFRL